MGTIGPSCASQLLGRLSSWGELFAIFRLIFWSAFPPRSHSCGRAKGVYIVVAVCGRRRFSARVLTRRKFMEQILRHFHSSKFRPLPSFIEKAVGRSRVAKVDSHNGRSLSRSPSMSTLLIHRTHMHTTLRVFALEYFIG